MRIGDEPFWLHMESTRRNVLPAILARYDTSEPPSAEQCDFDATFRHGEHWRRRSIPPGRAAVQPPIHPAPTLATIRTAPEPLHDAHGNTVPAVALYTYQLSGTITDAAGKPVQGAVVTTRTQDRDYWDFSSASDANGHYLSFFPASDETAADPVPLSVGVGYGATSYGGATGTIANFARLQNAVLNIQLGTGSKYTLEKPSSYPGAVYSGLVVGASAGGVIKPLAERWPDAQGNFSMVLPRSARGKLISFWENERQYYSRFAGRPGGPVDLGSWPAHLGPAAASPVATLRLP